MSTVVHLDDHLASQAAKLAAETGRSLAAVVEEAVREKLLRRETDPPAKPFQLITFGQGGLQPGVDLNNSAALLERSWIPLVILLDVNVLVYAARADAENHERFAEWLTGICTGDEAFGVSELALSGCLRIITNTRIFKTPTPLETALAFVDQIHRRPQCIIVRPGESHWSIFLELCRTVNARGNLVPDAYFAALAIEHDCEWITTDRGYARYPGLKQRMPF